MTSKKELMEHAQRVVAELKAEDPQTLRDELSVERAAHIFRDAQLRQAKADLVTAHEQLNSSVFRETDLRTEVAKLREALVSVRDRGFKVNRSLQTPCEKDIESIVLSALASPAPTNLPPASEQISSSPATPAEKPMFKDVRDANWERVRGSREAFEEYLEAHGEYIRDGVLEEAAKAVSAALGLHIQSGKVYELEDVEPVAVEAIRSLKSSPQPVEKDWADEEYRKACERARQPAPETPEPLDFYDPGFTCGHGAPSCDRCTDSWSKKERAFSGRLIAVRNEAAEHIAAIEKERDEARGQYLGAKRKLEEMRKALDRDKTGLAAALDEVRKVLGSFGWIPEGTWGSYEYQEHTHGTIRREVADAFERIHRIVRDALKASGDIADAALSDAPPGEKAGES